MEPKVEKKLTREEFEEITSEMRALVGDKLRNHRDGDAERLLFKELFKKQRAGSHANS